MTPPWLRVRDMATRGKQAATTAALVSLLGVLSAILLIRGAFSAADCAAGGTDDPPPRWPTPDARQLASRATLDCQLALTPPGPTPTTELDLPGSAAPGPDEELTYYPEWEAYLTEAQATMQAKSGGGTEWLDIRPPEAGGSIGGQAAQPDAEPC
jgi:hypothetical protein